MRKLNVLAFALLLSLLASACTRSASSTSAVTPTQDVLNSVFSTIATQTALANKDKSPDSIITELPTATPTGLLGATATLEASPTEAPTATKTLAPISDQTVPSSYTLHQGEWPYCLARRFNIDPAAILAANGLTEDQAANLSVGATLTIPVGEVGSYGPGRELRSHPTSYPVGSTDTFYSIACAFGDVWPENIAEANGMDLGDALQAGMTLQIP